MGLKTNVTPQSLPIVISFYRHNKSSGTHINGGVMCWLHPSELHIYVYRSTVVLNSLFMSFSLESIHSLLILYVCDLELCLKWLDISWGSAAKIQEAFSAFLHFVFLPVLYYVHICFTSFNIQIELGDVVWVETFSLCYISDELFRFIRDSVAATLSFCCKHTAAEILCYCVDYSDFFLFSTAHWSFWSILYYI